DRGGGQGAFPLVLYAPALGSPRDALATCSFSCCSSSGPSSPSANFSAARSALRTSLVNRCSMRRQQAHANSRRFRSLSLPRTNSSIGSGSLQVHHSASSTRFTSLVWLVSPGRQKYSDTDTTARARRFPGHAATTSGSLGSATGYRKVLSE